MPNREWTIRADKGKGLTAQELIGALELAPPDSQPRVLINWGGTIKQLTIKTNREEQQ